MDTLTIQEGSQQITGDLEVLGSINNAGIDGIKTDVETAKGDLQIVASTVVEQWASLADDAVITTAEKKTIRDVWHGAETEYPLIHARGVEAGVPVAGYEAAYEALRVYLYGEPGILLDMATPSDVDRAEYTAAFGGYTEQRETLLAAVGTVAYETAELAGMYLTCSTDQVERNRAGTLSPAAITAYAYHSDGTAYAGRFVIEITTGPGLPWTRIDASEEDEDSHETTIPGAIGDNLTTSARISVYMAGGETTLLKMMTIPIVYAATVAPVYLGAFSTVAAWPTEGVLDGDYILDTRPPVESGPAEGGVMRRMTPTGWAEYLMTDPGYQDAFQRAKFDLMVWATTYGVTTIVALNAIFRSVAASQAFLDELRVNEAEILGTLKTGTGAADNARVAIIDSAGVISKTFNGTGANDLSIAQEGLTAGTVVVEITEAQVGDTGPSGGTVVSLAPNIEASPNDLADAGWDAAVAAAAAATIGGKNDWALPTRSQLQAIHSSLASIITEGIYWSGEDSGTHAYAVDMSTGAEGLYEKIRGTAIAETLPTSMYRFTSQLYDGKIYMPQHGGSVLEIYDIASDTTEIKTIPTNSSLTASILYNGKIYMIGSGVALYVYDIASGTTVTKTLPTSMYRYTSQLYNGKIYMPSGNGTTLEIYDIASGTTVTKTLSTSMQRYTSQLYNGKIYMPQHGGSVLEIYDIASGTTVTKTLPTSMQRYTSQLYNGKIYMPQYAGNVLEIYDIASGTTVTKTLSTSMQRYTSQLYNGKIYMPQYAGNVLEIYDIASGTTATKTLSTSMRRATSQLYDGKIYMPQHVGDTLEIYSMELSTRPIRTNTETKRWTHQLDAGAPVAHGPIVAGAIYDAAIDIKVSWPDIDGHVVGDAWTLVQDSMIGMSIRDVSGEAYCEAYNGQVNVRITSQGIAGLVPTGAGIVAETGDGVTERAQEFGHGFKITVSTSAPSGGRNGDIWFTI